MKKEYISIKEPEMPGQDCTHTSVPEACNSLAEARDSSVSEPQFEFILEAWNTASKQKRLSHLDLSDFWLKSTPPSLWNLRG